MKLERRTWVLTGLALTSLGLAYADPWASERDGPGFVSTRSAARRLFPTLVDAEPATTRIVLRSDAGLVEITPSAHGHHVIHDGALLGPADPEAVDGLIASLRLATTLRAVSDDADLGPAQRGAVEVHEAGQPPVVLEVGGSSPDNAGAYGTLIEGEATSVWVVEPEVAMLLDQRPEGWLASRTFVLEPPHVERVAFASDGATLERSDDGLWRSSVGATRTIVDGDTVEARLERLISARLDPWLPNIPEGGEPWVTLFSIGGRTDRLDEVGLCPGHPERVAVRRGPGWGGCLAAERLAAWPLPGRHGLDDGWSWVHPRLAPVPYGRVIALEQTRPSVVTLRRDAGSWTLEQPSSSRRVGDAEVFAWYQALHDAEVSVDPDVVCGSDCVPRDDVEMTVRSDGGAVTLHCVRLDDWRCRRDAGPWLTVRGDMPALELGEASFRDRTLVAVEPGEARAIEVSGPTTPRQSVHFDLGVWRLDAPAHPQGDTALSEVVLEDWLATLGSLRVETWVGAPSGEPLRSLSVDLTPRRGRPSTVELQLHAGCVASVGDRAGRLAEVDCERLSTDVLHGDPVADWVQTARSLELSLDDSKVVRWTRDGKAWRPDASNPQVERALQRLAAVVDARLARGTPEGATQGKIRVLPGRGAAFVASFGERWLRLGSEDDPAPWHYAW